MKKNNKEKIKYRLNKATLSTLWATNTWVVEILFRIRFISSLLIFKPQFSCRNFDRWPVVYNNLYNIITKIPHKKFSEKHFVHIFLWILPLLCSLSALGQNTESKTDTITIKKSNGVDFPIDYNADDSVILDLPGKKVHLYGHAKVHYDDITLTAWYILVDFNTRDLFARPGIDSVGKMFERPHFADAKDQFSSDSMKYNFNNKRALVYNARTVQNDGYIFGQITYKDPSNNTYVKNARYTTCNDTFHPHFYILTKKLKIIPKKQVVTGPANLVIAEVNTPLFIPFGFFPIMKGQSKGIIFPTYGETQDRGFYLRNFGYYLPVSKYFDLALTGDYYFRGSYGVHMNSNYARKYHFRGNLGIDYVHNKFGEQETGIRISNDYTIRWTYNMDAKARPGRYFNANVNYQSSNYNRNNSYNQQNIIQSTVQSSLNYRTSLLRNNLNISLGSRIVQNLGREEVNLAFPELNLNVPRITPFANSKLKNKAIKTIGLSYNGDFKNSLLMKQKNLGPSLGLEANPNNINIADSLKNSIVHSIPLSASIKLFKYFQLNPALSYSEYWYFKSQLISWDPVKDTINTSISNGFNRASSIQGSLTLNTQLFGMAQFKKGRLQALRHVLTPSISMVLKPNFETFKNGFRTVQIDTAGRTRSYSIFESNQSGYPSGRQEASIGINLNNNIEMKVRKHTDTGVVSKKIKLIEMLNIGASHNFIADSFKWSNISFNGRSTLFKDKVSINYGCILDPYQYTDRRIDKLEVTKRVSLGRLTSANVSMGTNFNPAARKTKTSNYASREELMMINSYPQFFVDFTIPWSLQLNYNLNYTHPTPVSKTDFRQSITFNGDIKLTENWKIAFGSGYDFKTKELALTKIDFFRDLHCWEFSFGWIPVGFRRSFDFTIRVKSSTLQDLKLNRRNFWFDN